MKVKTNESNEYGHIVIYGDIRNVFIFEINKINLTKKRQ